MYSLPGRKTDIGHVGEVAYFVFAKFLEIEAGMLVRMALHSFGVVQQAEHLASRMIVFEWSVQTEATSVYRSGSLRMETPTNDQSCRW